MVLARGRASSTHFRTPPRTAQGPRRRAPPDLVLFDLDETLFDDHFARSQGLAAVRRKNDVLRARPLSWLRERYGELLQASHREEVELGIDPTTARHERFRRLGVLCGASWSDREIDRYVAEYRAGYSRGVRAVPGSSGLLARVRRRAQIGIVTNSRVREQEEKLAAIGLDHRVDFMVVSEGVGFWKPDPRIFQAALDRAHVDPPRAVMIGDSWEADIMGAHASGIRAVWFDRYERSRPAHPRGVEVVRSFLPPRLALRALRIPG